MAYTLLGVFIAFIALIICSVFWIQYAYGRRKFYRLAKKLFRRWSSLPLSEQVHVLNTMHHFVFEEFVLLSLRHNYQANTKRNKRYTGDHGIDGCFTLNQCLFIVQCKRYKGYVKSSDLRQFHRQCRVRKVRGLFITTGDVSQQLISSLPPTIIVITRATIMDFLRGKRTDLLN